MSCLEINGGRSLYGTVSVQGSKNAVLPMMAAALLNKGITVIKNVPYILDVCYMIKIMNALGCRVKYEQGTLTMDASCLTANELPLMWAGKMRSSIMLLGALIGRCREAVTYYPGGCSIGARPIDLHIEGLRKLGVTFLFEGDRIEAKAEKLTGAQIVLPFPSVGATENILLAAVNAEGVTCIRGAAREPEIVELCGMLNQMGALISGVGSDTLMVHGTDCFRDCLVKASGDRIVAATYLMTAAACRGEVMLTGAPSAYMQSSLAVLRQMGCLIRQEAERIVICADKAPLPIPYTKTAPYPGFPTDVQSQLMAVLCFSEGTSVIEEAIFEGRFNTAWELKKMGADIIIEGRLAVIHAGTPLRGTCVEAKDLRGGAALVIAGLAAEGRTQIQSCHHIFRGYAGIEFDLQQLGADIIADHGSSDCGTVNYGNDSNVNPGKSGFGQAVQMA